MEFNSINAQQQKQLWIQCSFGTVKRLDTQIVGHITKTLLFGLLYYLPGTFAQFELANADTYANLSTEHVQSKKVQGEMNEDIKIRVIQNNHVLRQHAFPE